MRLPSYSQPILAPVSFNSESWDTILLNQSQKRKFQNFCELFMDRVRTGASNGEEVEKFTTLLKGKHPEYFRLARGVVPEFKFGNATKPCNQHVQRIVCSLHDLIVRPSVVHQFDGTADGPKPTVDQAAADREALARVMFGPGTNWASNPRMKRLLDSTIELGFPQTSTTHQAQMGYPSLRDALGLRVDVRMGDKIVESGPSSAVEDWSTATSSQESGGAVPSTSRLVLDEYSPAKTRAGMHRPPGL